MITIALVSVCVSGPDPRGSKRRSDVVSHTAVDGVSSRASSAVLVYHSSSDRINSEHVVIVPAIVLLPFLAPLPRLSSSRQPQLLHGSLFTFTYLRMLI